MTEEIQLSDAEKRLLRRVFHRHALPYIAALGVIALIAISSGSEEAAEIETEEWVAEAPAPSLDDVEALLETQGRAEELLAELQASTEKHKAGLDAAERKIAALEKRLATTARRLGKVESIARQAMEAATEARAELSEAVKVSTEIPRAKPREAPKESAKITRANPSQASSPVSIQDKLRSLSPQQAQTRPGATREKNTLPAAPADVSVPMDDTP